MLKSMGIRKSDSHGHKVFGWEKIITDLKTNEFLTSP
ncbi:hypothetical protein IGI42_000679 [Enterococcus sp. AZ109]